MRGDEFEMLDHGMRAVGAELADHAQHHRLGLRALELDLALAEIGLDAGELAEEVVVPKRAAELAVGDRSQPNVLLLADDRLDLAVFDRLERGRAQQASHVIGAKRRLGAGHALPYRLRRDDTEPAGDHSAAASACARFSSTKSYFTS